MYGESGTDIRGVSGEDDVARWRHQASQKAQHGLMLDIASIYELSLYIFTVPYYIQRLCVYIYFLFHIDIQTRRQSCFNTVPPSGGIHLYHYVVNQIGVAI